MTVPYTFANRTGNIPLSELDANFSNVSAFSSTAGTVTSSAQPNIASVGALNNLAVVGLIAGSSLAIVGNISSSNLSVTGNISGGNIFGTLVGNISNAVFANTAGVVTTAAQPNITSVGTLVTLTVTGNISSTGNIIPGNVLSTGILRGLTIQASGNLVAGNANILTAVNSAIINANTVNANTVNANTVNTSTTSTSSLLSNSISTTGNVTVGGTAGSPLKTKASGDTGTAGQITWDANYIYVCVATNTWKRAALVGF